MLGATPAAHFPAFHVHVDVLLVTAAFVVGYFTLVRTVGPLRVAPGESPVTRFQIACYSGGVLAMFLASTWPVHDIAEGSLFSVHMVQHLTYSLIAAPLMLLGTPGWMLRVLLKPRWLFRTVRACSRFVPAVVIFNVVIVVTHWPLVVNTAITHHWFHFLVHVVVFSAAILAWLPVLSPLPEVPRLSSIGRMVFLFTQSIVPTVPASFLTFGTTPLYRSYEHLPHLFGLSVLNDQLIAGLIMKIGAGTLLWACIAVIWFKWATREERAARPGWQNLDGDLQKMGMTHR